MEVDQWMNCRTKSDRDTSRAVRHPIPGSGYAGTCSDVKRHNSQRGSTYVTVASALIPLYHAYLLVLALSFK